MLYKLICPQCGANMDMDDTRKFMFCPFCGTKIVNISQTVEINQNFYYNKTDKQKNYPPSYPNNTSLIIDYFSTDPNVPMTVVLCSINQRITLISGQELSFYLPAGEQFVVIKIGFRSHKKKINVFNNCYPVKIHCTWTGVQQIIIEPSTADTYGLVGVNSFKRKK